MQVVYAPHQQLAHQGVLAVAIATVKKQEQVSDPLRNGKLEQKLRTCALPLPR